MDNPFDDMDNVFADTDNPFEEDMDNPFADFEHLFGKDIDNTFGYNIGQKRMDECSYDCKSLQTFVANMKYHELQSSDYECNQANILKTLNCYIHLIAAHADRNEQFEYVFDKLGICFADKCDIFKRNYRNRKLERECKQSMEDVNDTVYAEIMDKMHCYFSHVSNRLSSQDKALLESTDNEIKTDDENTLVNTRMYKMNQILSSKSYIAITQSTNNKYNQIISFKDHQLYSIGYKFKYNDTDNHWEFPDKTVYPKFVSLKEESTNNKCCCLSVNQFEKEYRKAEVHFNTDFRRGNYSQMLLQHIISLMIYCNYTEYQNHFT
eukprot:353330_1